MSYNEPTPETLALLCFALLASAEKPCAISQAAGAASTVNRNNGNYMVCVKVAHFHV